MSYVYEKRGLGATRGEVSVIPEPIPEPFYDPTAMRNIDPAPAPYTIETSQVAPMNVEQAPYFNERIVAGPTPTIESTLSVLDAPTTLATRSLSTPEAQLRTAQESLQQALQPMQSVDTRYSDPSLFTDVDVRPTLTVAETPTQLAYQPPREMPSNFVLEPTTVTRSTLAPVLDVAPTEPTIVAAMREAQSVERLMLSPSSGYETITPVSQPMAQRGESLFDDPHPNLLEPVVTQSPVTGSKYATLFSPDVETIQPEPSTPAGTSEGVVPAGAGKTCQSGYYYTELGQGCAKIVCAAGTIFDSSIGACTTAEEQAERKAREALPKELQQMPVLFGSAQLRLQCSSDPEVLSLAKTWFDTTAVAAARESLLGRTDVKAFSAKYYVGGKSLITTCALLKAALVEWITMLGGTASGATGGGSSLPLIAGAAALALLFFRR